MSGTVSYLADAAGRTARYLTIKSKDGRPRWVLTWSLIAAVIFAAMANFGIGALFGNSSAFDKLKDKVKLAIAADTVDPVVLWRDMDSETIPISWTPIETNNKSLETLTVPLAKFDGRGGGLVEVDGKVLFATPKGRIGVYAEDAQTGSAEISYLDGRVPLGIEAFHETDLAEQFSIFYAGNIRVMGVEVQPVSPGVWNLFATHHHFDDMCFSFVVSKTTLVERDGALALLDSVWEPVFRAKPCLELKTTGNAYGGMRDGGRMAWLPNGNMLISIGDFDMDGDNSPITAPQLPEYDQGKLIEFNPETADYRHYAIGMRNPQGLYVAADGRVFTTEHGPNGGDEVNSVVEGENYGWPTVTLGMAYGWPRRDWLSNPQQGRHDVEGVTPPIYAFLPSIGISALIEVQSPLFPEWRGDLLVASLKAQTMWRLRRNGDRIIYAEQTNLGHRLRDMVELSDGRIAILTDSATLLFLRPDAGPPRPDEVAPIKDLMVAGYGEARQVDASVDWEIAQASRGEHIGRAIFENKCSSCHAVDEPEIVAAPHLYRLRGRRVGSLEGFPYSEALTGRKEVWTEERLRRYISDPQSVFPETTMQPVHMSLPEYLHIAWYIMNCTGGNDRKECKTSAG